MDSVESSHGFDAGRVVSHDSPDAPSWAGELFAADAAWATESSISSDVSSSSGESSGEGSRSSDNS